jgi:glycosyltransferase involved in cell wall biosynthesis
MLAILTTHPIQYQVPIWRGLAARGDVPFKVYFMSDQGLRASFDPGFGRALAWDIDLLSGYPHEFIDVHTGPHQDRFTWLRLKPGFVDRLRADGVSVLWVNGWQVLAYWQAVRAAKRCGMEIWLRGETNRRSNRGGLAQSLKWLLLRRLLNRVDRFLTIGSANRAFYLRLGYRDEQMAMAPYGVDNRRFAEQAGVARSARDVLRVRWGIPSDAFCFLSVGKFVPKKRPLDLVAAVVELQRRLPQRRLHLLWVGSGELAAALQAGCAIAYDGAGGVRIPAPADQRPAASFVGFINQSEIGNAYAAADALVLPSDAKETWGLVVNEAMASGLPCVVSDACGCAEDLVQPLRPDLCFPVGDIDALVNALAAVVGDPPPVEPWLRHIDHFDVARTVEAVAALYHERFAQRAASQNGK